MPVDNVMYIFKEGAGVLGEYSRVSNRYSPPDVSLDYISGICTNKDAGWDCYVTNNYYYITNYDYLCVEITTPNSWTELQLGCKDILNGNLSTSFNQAYNRKILTRNISNLTGSSRIFFAPKMKNTYIHNIWLTNEMPVQN